MKALFGALALSLLATLPALADAPAAKKKKKPTLCARASLGPSLTSHPDAPNRRTMTCGGYGNTTRSCPHREPSLALWLG